MSSNKRENAESQPNEPVPANPRKKPKKRAESSRVETLCIADLRPLMHLTLEQAADKLKVGTTVLKRVARKCGIDKWPSRQIAWLDLKIETISDRLASASGCKRAKLDDQLAQLLRMREEAYATGKVAAGVSKRWKARHRLRAVENGDPDISEADDEILSSPQTSVASTPSTSSFAASSEGGSFLPQAHHPMTCAAADEQARLPIDLTAPILRSEMRFQPWQAISFQAAWPQINVPATLPDVHFDAEDLLELDHLLLTAFADGDCSTFDIDDIADLPNHQHQPVHKPAAPGADTIAALQQLQTITHFQLPTTEFWTHC